MDSNTILKIATCFWGLLYFTVMHGIANFIAIDAVPPTGGGGNRGNLPRAPIVRGPPKTVPDLFK